MLLYSATLLTVTIICGSNNTALWSVWCDSLSSFSLYVTHQWHARPFLPCNWVTTSELGSIFPGGGQMGWLKCVENVHKNVFFTKCLDKGQQYHVEIRSRKYYYSDILESPVLNITRIVVLCLISFIFCKRISLSWAQKLDPAPQISNYRPPMGRYLSENTVPAAGCSGFVWL